MQVLSKDFSRSDKTVVSEVQERRLPVFGNNFRSYRCQDLTLKIGILSLTGLGE